MIEGVQRKPPCPFKLSVNVALAGRPVTESAGTVESGSVATIVSESNSLAKTDLPPIGNSDGG